MGSVVARLPDEIKPALTTGSHYAWKALHRTAEVSGVWQDMLGLPCRRKPECMLPAAMIQVPHVTLCCARGKQQLRP